MERLCEDAVVHVLSFLPAIDLFRIGFVTSRLRSLSSRDHLWTPLVRLRNAEYSRIVEKSNTEKRANPPMVSMVGTRNHLMAMNDLRWDALVEFFESRGARFCVSIDDPPTEPTPLRGFWWYRQNSIRRLNSFIDSNDSRFLRLDAAVLDGDDGRIPWKWMAVNKLVLTLGPVFGFFSSIVSLGLLLAFAATFGKNESTSNLLSYIGISFCSLSLIFFGATLLIGIVLNDWCALVSREKRLQKMHDIMKWIPLELMNVSFADLHTVAAAEKPADESEYVHRRGIVKHRLARLMNDHRVQMCWPSFLPCLCMFAIVPAILLSIFLRIFIGVYALMPAWILLFVGVLLLVVYWFACLIRTDRIRKVVYNLTYSLKYTFWLWIGLCLIWWVPVLIVLTVEFVVVPSGRRTVGWILMSLLVLVFVVGIMSVLSLIVILSLRYCSHRASNLRKRMREFGATCSQETPNRIMGGLGVFVLLLGLSLPFLFFMAVASMLYFLGVLPWVGVIFVFPLPVCGCIATVMVHLLFLRESCG